MALVILLYLMFAGMLVSTDGTLEIGAKDNLPYVEHTDHTISIHLRRMYDRTENAKGGQKTVLHSDDQIAQLVNQGEVVGFF